MARPKPPPRRFEITPQSVIIGVGLFTAILAIIVGLILLEEHSRGARQSKTARTHIPSAKDEKVINELGSEYEESKLTHSDYITNSEEDSRRPSCESNAGNDIKSQQRCNQLKEKEDASTISDIVSENVIEISEPQKVKYCISSKCLIAGTRILNSMKCSAKPCDDFYEYACGEHKPEAASLFAQISESNLLGIARLISQITDKNFKYVKKVRQYFDLCFDEETVNKNSKKELLAALKDIGTWPMLIKRVQWNSTNFNMVDALGKLRRRGFYFNHFFDFSIGHDHENSKRIIILDRPPLGISAHHLIEGPDNVIVQAYTQYIIKIFKALGVSNPDRDVQKIVDLEIILAKMIPADNDTETYDHYEKLSISDLQAKYPVVNWLVHLNWILYPDARLQSSEMVYVSEPDYFKGLAEFMKSQKPSNRLLANYMLWHTIRNSMPYMDSTMSAIQEEFNEVTGADYLGERGRVCTLRISAQMHLALSAMFVRKVFDKDVVEPVRAMAENIRQSFVQVLREVSWMDARTKKEAVEKIEKLDVKVGYPKELLNKSNLNEYYKNFKIDGTSYFETGLSFNRFILEKEIKDFREPLDKSDWRDLFGNAIYFNVFYTPRNVVFIPAAAIPYYLFDMEYPNFINYARLGQAIGHEMAHALDKKNRIFDSNGVRRDWWSQPSAKRYSEKMQCISEQYRDLFVGTGVPDEQLNLQVDGRRSLNENMADLGGTKIAYRAYTSWLERNGGRDTQLGVEFPKFTPRQMFWIAYASMLCEPNASYEQLVSGLGLDEHPPNKIRVLNSLVNLPEFTRDFDCKPDDPINGRIKCDMWSSQT